MIEKKIKMRSQQKHDIEANWLKAAAFIPMAGELIVYDPDANYNYARLKIGDGNTSVVDLTFVDEYIVKELLKKADIEHKHSEYLTEHQDLSGKADKDHVHASYALKEEIPSIEGLASKEYVDNAVNNLNIPEVDLSNYYNKTEIADLLENLDVEVESKMAMTDDTNGNVVLVDITYIKAAEGESY